MDIDTWILPGVAGLFILNHGMVMVPDWHHRRGLFYGVQLLNFLGACFLAGWGAPGFNEMGLRVVNWMLMALVIYHIVQNNSRLLKVHEQDGMEDGDRERLRRMVLAKLVDSEE